MVAGLRQGHKMKSKEKPKKEKLAGHFSSDSQNGALFSFCHFVNNSSHGNFLLTKSAQTKVFQQAKRGEKQNNYEIFLTLQGP